MLIGLPVTSGSGIPLGTSKGAQIDNAPSGSPSAQCYAKFARLRQLHLDWRVRKGAVGGYNCAGLVWAARRTAITDSSCYDLIRVDDGYRALSKGEEPIKGDLVVYFYCDPPNTRQYIHVGIVWCKSKPKFAGVKVQESIYVLSKLDPTSGEVLHAVDDHPFKVIPDDFEYWTDRPAGNVLA